MKRVKTAPEGPRRYEGMFLVESGLSSNMWIVARSVASPD